MKDLLMPRYKVIADYPYQPFDIGEILPDRNFEFFHITTIEYKNEFGENVRSANWVDSVVIDKYPHLFRKLFWWEDRAVEEMEQVKYAKSLSGNSVRTVLRFELWWNKIILDGGKVRPIKQWIPATFEEYTSYQKSEKQF